MDIQALEQYVKSIPDSKDFQCGICDYISNRPAKVKNHLEAIHFPGVFVVIFVKKPLVVKMLFVFTKVKLIPKRS